MRRLLTSLFVTAIVVTGLVVSLSSTEATPPSAASAFFQNTQTGNPGFQSMGRMSFGPHGLLLITDPLAAAGVTLVTVPSYWSVELMVTVVPLTLLSLIHI